MTGGRFDPFAGTGPRWRAVPAWRPFLEDLAAGVLDWLGDQTPETLTDATILLPNRRAARAFSSALGKLAGDRPVLLPQVRPLGEGQHVEEDLLEGGGGASVAQRADHGGELLGHAERLEQASRLVGVAEPEQSLERGQRHDGLRLRPVVLVGARRVGGREAEQRLAGVPGDGLLARGVGLQAQRAACGEELQEVGEPGAELGAAGLAEDLRVRVDEVGEGGAVLKGRRAVRMRAEPVLGPRQAIRLPPQNARNVGDAAPGKMLNLTVESAHGVVSPLVVLHRHPDCSAPRLRSAPSGRRDRPKDNDTVVIST